MNIRQISGRHDVEGVARSISTRDLSRINCVLFISPVLQLGLNPERFLYRKRTATGASKILTLIGTERNLVGRVLNIVRS